MKLTNLLAILLGILITQAIQTQPEQNPNNNFIEKLNQSPESIKDLVEHIFKAIDSLKEAINKIKQESYSNEEKKQRYQSIAQSAIWLKLITNSFYEFIILNIKKFPRETWKILKENLDCLNAPLKQLINELEQVIEKIKIESPTKDILLTKIIELNNFDAVNRCIIESTKQIKTELQKTLLNPYEELVNQLNELQRNLEISSRLIDISNDPIKNNLMDLMEKTDENQENFPNEGAYLNYVNKLGELYKQYFNRFDRLYYESASDSDA